MNKISLFDDYGISDAGNEEKIKSIIDVIAINEPDILLDLRHCIIDYPATSMLIDKILNKLATLPNQKRLNIEVSYLLPEQTLLNDLLGDSKFFNIEAKKEIPIEKLRIIINSKLEPSSIFLTVSIKDGSNQLRDQFTYGKTI
jgi:hypothetical protein